VTGARHRAVEEYARAQVEIRWSDFAAFGAYGVTSLGEVPGPPSASATMPNFVLAVGPEL